MAIVNNTRTLAGQCMDFLRNITNYVSVNGEMHRDELALIGQAETKDGMISSGFFRSSFNSQFNLGTEVVTRSDGTIRNLILKYLPRATVSSVETDFANMCTAGSELAYNEHNVSPDSLSIARKKVTVIADNWDKACESIDEIIGRHWMAQLNAINQRMDADLASQIIAGAGANGAHPTLPTTIPDDSLIANYRTVDIIDADSVPIWAGTNQMRIDMAQNEVTGIPAAVLFGHSNAFGTYVHARDVGCCNDKGVDIGEVVRKMNGFAPFSGRQVENAFVTNGLSAADAATAAAVLHPGSAHLIEYFDFDRHPYQDGMSYGTTWIDPISGEEYDVKFTFDSCVGTQRKGQFIINIYKQYKAFTMPTDQFATGDIKENQNGIMLYQFT